MDLRSIADRVLRPRLLSIQGVAQVAVIGGDVKEMQVKLNSAAMKNFGVSLDDVLNACGSMTQNAAGGIVNDF